MFDKYTGLKSQNALSKEGETKADLFKKHIENTNRRFLTEEETKKTYSAFLSQPAPEMPKLDAKDEKPKPMTGVSERFPQQKDHDIHSTFLYVGQSQGCKEKAMKIRANMLDYQPGVKVHGRQLVEPCLKSLHKLHLTQSFNE